MATKTFRPGEVANGGLIKATCNNQTIDVKFLDWNTKKTLIQRSFDVKGSRNNILFFVDDNATWYWCCKVVEWLDQHVPDAKAFIR